MRKQMVLSSVMVSFFAVFTAESSTRVDCGADAQSATSLSNCSLADSNGGNASASASESYTVTQGLFDYLVTARSFAHPDNSGSGLTTAASANVQNNLDLFSSGPIRSGYIDFLNSSLSVTAIDSGLTAEGIGAFQISGIYSTACTGTAAGGFCTFPSSSRLLPVTLGTPIDFIFQTSGSASGSTIFGDGTFLLNANIQVELFEADGVTQAPITNAVAITPEPATVNLLVVVVSCMALLKKTSSSSS